MSLVLTSLHPSSLELRYLVPPCPGRSLSLCRVMKECAWCEKRALAARLCVLPRFGCSAVWSREKTPCSRPPPAPNPGRVSKEIPRSCQRIPQHLPISWAKTCPLRKILTNHRCIKLCRSMSRHGVTQNGKVFGTKTFQA